MFLEMLCEWVMWKEMFELVVFDGWNRKLFVVVSLGVGDVVDDGVFGGEFLILVVEYFDFFVC